MKLGTTRSPKFRRLSRVAGLSTRETVGTLELLWLFTMEQAPAGDIGKWPDEEIEEVCDWNGKRGVLIAALVESAWLDRCGKHRLIVHDWADHVPEFIRLRIKRGSMQLAEIQPAGERPDGDQSPTSRQRVAVDREGKGREANQREVRESPEPAAPGATAPTKIKVAKKKPETPVPERLTDDDRARVVAWAADQKPPLSQHALTYGWKVYFARADAKQYRYADHARGFMNALGAAGEAWALNGYEPPATSGGSRYRMADHVIAEAKRRQAEDDERAKPTEDPRAIGQLIDFSLRQASAS